MKIGIIAKPNSKGQVVIPKKMRSVLGINTNTALNFVLAGDGIYIHPVTEVLTKSETDSSYIKLLEKTKGAWAEDNWGRLAKSKSKLELDASRARKNSW